MGGIISSLKKTVDAPNYVGIKTVKLGAEEFFIGNYLAEGGSGKIHVGKRKSDGMLVVSELK